MLPDDPAALYAACHGLLQRGVWALLATTPLLGAALTAASALRRRADNPVAACAALRLTLLTACVLPIVALLTFTASFSEHARPTERPPLLWSPPQPPLNGVVLSPSHPDTPVPPELPPLLRHDPGPWYLVVIAVWGGGTLLILAGLRFSHQFLLRLRREGVPVPKDAPANRALASLPAGSDVPPPVLLTHPRVSVPFAALFADGRRRVIFLPEDPAALTPDALPVVLAHEWAHLRRSDHAWGLGARLACALFWLQPLFWLLLREMEAAQEMICDREALRLTGSTEAAPALANSLLYFAERFGTLGAAERRATRFTGTAVALPSRSLLEERIHTIMRLKVTVLRPPVLSSCVRAGIAGGMVLALGLILTFSRPLARTAAAALPIPVSYAATDDALSAPAQGVDPFLEEVTADFRDLPVEEAIRKTLAGTDLTFAWDDDIGAGARKSTVTLKATGVLRRQLLSLVCRSAFWLRSEDASTPAPLRWRREGSIIRIGRTGTASTARTEVGPDYLPVGRTSVVFPERTPLLVVLSKLFQGTGVEYDIRGADGRPIADGPSVTTYVRAENQTYKAALEAILRHASRPLRYRVHDDGRVEILDDTPPRPRPFIQGDAKGTGLPTTPVSLTAENMPLRDALRKVLTEARADFSMDNAIAGTVTGTYENMPLNQVLPRLLAQASIPTAYTVQSSEKPTLPPVIIIRPVTAR